MDDFAGMDAELIDSMGDLAVYTSLDATYTKEINALIERQVEFIDEDELIGIKANVAYFAAKIIDVRLSRGDTITQDGRIWTTGKVVQDDGYLIGVIVT